MKILITTQFGGVAGSTYSIFYLAKGLKEIGHHVIVGIPQNTLLENLCIKERIQVAHIPFAGKFDFSSMKIIRDIVKKERIDLINAQESKDRYNVIFSKLFFNLPVKIVLTRRQRVADNNPIKRWLHVKYSDKIVVISEGLKNIVIRKGFPAGHLEVIYNGIPTDQYLLEKEKIDRLRKKYNISPRDKVIGCVARPKLQNELVEAVKTLPSEYKILLVGISMDQFAKRFQECDISLMKDRIIFAGVVREKSEVFHHFALMDVHVLPSRMDGFGLVTVEAMAMGVPVIGSNYGGIPDVIEHEKGGLIYENGDIDTLKNQILRMITNESDREKFISEGFRKALYQFSINNTISNYEKLFLNLTQSN